MPSRASTSGSSSKTAGHEGDAVGVAGGLDPAGGLGAGVGVAVQADQPEAGVGVEHRQRVAGQAQGGVDQDGAVGGAGGGEQFGDALEQDGHVHRGARRRLGAAHRRLPLERSGVCACDGAAHRAPGCGTHGLRADADRCRWGAVGRGGASWGGVGRGSGERWGEGRGARPPRGPPGVGEERQVAPRGGGVGSPSAPGGAVRGSDSGPSRGEGGWGPDRSSRGEGGSFGVAARGPDAAGGGVPWDHDNVGIPSLSMSA